MRSRTSALPGALFILLLMPLTACSSAGHNGAGPPGSVLVAPVAHPGPEGVEQTLGLPLDAYFLSPADNAYLHRALDRLVESCAARAGVPLPPRTPPAAKPADRNARRYGLDDPEAAKARGYHPAEQPALADQPLAADQLATANACNTDAARKITGGDDYPSDARVVRELNMRSYELSLADPRVTSAVRDWSGCLRRAGYQANSPLDIENEFTATPSDRISARERELATADVACKRRTGLTRTWNGVEREHQERLLNAEKAAVGEAVLERETQLKRASEVLDEMGRVRPPTGR
ncbi:hypothetical protein ACFWHQ_28760 [Streptomyces sp. NPDC060334]|uniref:hypothetical protein n=1 Tax=Streptomyces sp. NPDC060334 TaxID=3347099 RepID=UPI00364BE4BB